MPLHRFLIAIFLTLLLVVPIANGSQLELPELSVAPGSPLRRNVDFWIRIYTQYDTNQGVIHDGKYIDKIYEVVDHPGGGRVLAAKHHWESVLLSVQDKLVKAESACKTDVLDRAYPCANLDTDETRVFKMYEDVHEPDKYLEAAHRKRLRYQQGEKSSFEEGVRMSGRYLPLMEEVFRKAGLPVELTRLPFVESSFNIRARSKVGASGIWQFMRSTGRLFLRIDDAVDERNDPIRSAEAAAALLKGNYDSLQNWSLAVTAYNHGRKGMMRAVRRVGSDHLDDVIESYRSRTFGFASGNFYAELLASIEVERHADQFFGKIRRETPLQGFEVPLPASIGFPTLCRFLKLDPNRLRELNPAITDGALRGKFLIPAGYRLRLPLEPGIDPASSARVFLAGFNEIPPSLKRAGAPVGL